MHRHALTVVFGIGLVVAACKADSTEAPASAPADAGPDVAQTDAVFSARLFRPAVERIVAIGDLHGDLSATRRALRLAGAIDESDKWIGGTLVVVQTGDEIDRGDDDRAILDLIERLKGESKAAGGELIALSGNHELMNAQLDFRYVTPGSLPAFAEFKPTSAMTDKLADVDEAMRSRGAAFFPGAPYAKMLADRPLFVKVGDNVFVHGGILPKHVTYGLDRMNDEVHAWLLGDRPEPPPVVVADDGPVWARNYSDSPDAAACATLERALTAMQGKRLVMGHTVQEGGIVPACEERGWLIDVGLSKYYSGKRQILDIQGDTVTVLD